MTQCPPSTPHNTNLLDVEMIAPDHADILARHLLNMTGHSTSSIQRYLFYANYPLFFTIHRTMDFRRLSIGFWGSDRIFKSWTPQFSLLFSSSPYADFVTEMEKNMYATVMILKKYNTNEDFTMPWRNDKPWDQVKVRTLTTFIQELVLSVIDGPSATCPSARPSSSRSLNSNPMNLGLILSPFGLMSPSPLNMNLIQHQPSS